MEKGTTPAMEQFLRFKADYPDAILLFRMGDFYETFYEDAVEASGLLGLTLTARNNGRSERIPMAGVPHHALDVYLARLIKAGKKVAICEQMEPPQPGKKIVRREVVQVVSPGTALSENLLDQGRNNYLAALCIVEDRMGLAVIDHSTGSFRVSEDRSENLWETLKRIDPAEIVTPESWGAANERLCAQRLPGTVLSAYEDWYFSLNYAYDALLEQFCVSSLKGFDCEDLKAGICAAGGAVAYLRRNEKGKLSHLTGMSRERTGTKMILDLVTQRNLELITSIQENRRAGTLLSVLNRTRTSMGARMIRRWLSAPLLEISKIEARLDAVEEFVASPKLRERIRDALRSMGDLERLISRVCCGRANPRDVAGLRSSMLALPHLRDGLGEARSRMMAEIRDGEMPDLVPLADLIGRTLEEEPPPTLSDGGIIRSGCNTELDGLRKVASGGRSWVAALQAKERKRTGISSLKVGYNRAFGYYIEVTKANVSRVPSDYIRKQTLVNAERYITPELKAWEAKILGADDRAKALERELFHRLREEVAEWVGAVQRNARSVARVDVLTSLAEVAALDDYVRPKILEEHVIQIEAGRHPVVERLLPDGKFVRNDVLVDSEKAQILIITGPNMAGKSTILRQVGLIVLMAQLGSFVPAASARIGVVDRIFTRVGASDNLAAGESTFLVEMNETANILNNATAKSLVLLDEIGRGTSTFDGLSIAWAMTEYLHNSAGICPRTLFATHYHELTELAEVLPRVVNLSVAVRKVGDEIAFLHRLVAGACDRSYGIEVAGLAGLPADLIARAKEVLARLEKNDLTMTGSTVSRSRKRALRGNQMGLFSRGERSTPAPEAHPVLSKLRGLDIEQTTPVEALQMLDAWKRKVECDDAAEERGEG